MKKVLLTNKFDTRDSFTEYAVKYSVPDFYFDFYGNNLRIYHVDLFKKGFNFQQAWPVEIEKHVAEFVIDDVKILVVSEDSANHSFNMNYAIGLAHKYFAQIVFIPLKNETFQYRNGVLVIGGDVLQQQKSSEEFSILITLDQGFLKNAVLNKHKKYSLNDYDAHTVKTFFGSKNVSHLKNKNVFSKAEAGNAQSRYNNQNSVDLTHLYNDHLVSFKALNTELNIDANVHGLADQSFSSYDKLHDKPSFYEDDINVECTLNRETDLPFGQDRMVELAKRAARKKGVDFNSAEYLQLVEQERREKHKATKDKYSDGFSDPRQSLKLNQDELISHMGDMPKNEFGEDLDMFGFDNQKDNVQSTEEEILRDARMDELSDEASFVPTVTPEKTVEEEPVVDQTELTEKLEADLDLLAAEKPLETVDEKAAEQALEEIVEQEAVADLSEPTPEPVETAVHPLDDPANALEPDAEDLANIPTPTQEILAAQADTSDLHIKKVSALFQKIRLFFKKLKLRKVHLDTPENVFVEPGSKSEPDEIAAIPVSDPSELIDESGELEKSLIQPLEAGADEEAVAGKTEHEEHLDFDHVESVVGGGDSVFKEIPEPPAIVYGGPELTSEVLADRGDRLERLAAILRKCGLIANQFDMITQRKSDDIKDRFEEVSRSVHENLLDKPIEKQFVNGKFEISNDDVDAMIGDFETIYANLERSNSKLINLAKRINLQDFIANKTKLTTNVLNDRKDKMTRFQDSNTQMLKDIENKFEDFEKELDELNTNNEAA